MVQYLHLLDPEIPIDQMFGVAIKKPISGVDIRPWWLYMGAAVGRWYLFKGKSPSSFHILVFLMFFLCTIKHSMFCLSLMHGQIIALLATKGKPNVNESSLKVSPKTFNFWC